MTSKAALFALLALWGVGFGGALPSRADDGISDNSSSEAKTETGMAADGFVNRVWQQTGNEKQPGVIRIFLSDGTLVMDSCWETHRLASWTQGADGSLTWNEDGTDINARIKALAADTLTLVLDLKSGPVEEHYAAAPIPSVCPDIPKA
jgi:hypothetical protein